MTIPPLTFNVSPMTLRTLVIQPCGEILGPLRSCVVDAVKSKDRRVCLEDAVLLIVEPGTGERM